jgi:hypothetical protein
MNKSLLAASCLAVTLLSSANGSVETETVDYAFRAPLDNGRGVSSMEDLRGKPVLIDFWGTR